MPKLYSALLHTHELLVSIYIILFTVKMVMLLMNNIESLAGFRKRTKVIGEMILPTLFIITGAWLATVSNAWGDTWFLVKFILIIVSVVAGLIAFRRNSKMLAIFTFLIFVYIMLLSYRKNPELKKRDNKAAAITESVVTDPHAAGYDVAKHGMLLYTENNCASCHGTKGDLGDRGAKDLTKSTLDDNNLELIIREGKGAMMVGYGHKLNADQIHALGQYVKALRK